MDAKRALHLTRRAFLRVLGLALGGLGLGGGGLGCSGSHRQLWPGVPWAEAAQPEAMRKRRLGRTDLMVSVVGYGGGVIGLPQQIPALQEAIRMGVNFIDTAHSYGGGRSEIVIGEAIEGLRDRVCIATKTGQRLAEGAAREIEESLRRLQVRRIDLLQMHGVGAFEGLEAILHPSRGALVAVREFQRQGKIGFVGITGAHSPIDGREPRPPEVIRQELAVMTEAIRTDQFDTMMLSYHVEWQGEPVQRLIQFARDHDVGVIAKKPLGGGKLIAQYGARRLLQFVLENPDVHTAIPGMARIEHVHEDVPVGYGV